MKREIKFRVWDKAEKQMIYSGVIGAGSGAEIINIDFNGEIHLSNYYGLDFATKNPAFDVRESRFSLMQYTGRKDKNGKEIYEGDIINAFNRKEELAPNKFKVYWSGYTSAFAIESINIGETLKLPISPGHFYKTYEVIGSIYENPELIKDGGEA